MSDGGQHQGTHWTPASTAGDGGHAFLFHHPPEAKIVARCARCGQIVATYGAAAWDCDHTPPADWHGPSRCSCMPAPVLPAGEDLGKLLDRARRQRAGKPITTRV